MRAQGIALPIINISTWLERRDDKISELRIAAGPSGPTPRRITAAEELLLGRNLTEDMHPEALNTLLDQIQFRTSPQRATAEYRHHLVKDLLVDTLLEAWKRAG
jgi:carbon-monoxide dehydrogenase medium subunit